MARSRNIKPGFFTNEDLVELGFATRLLFAGLWTMADREGRLEDRPKKIKIGVFPADDVNADAMLQELHDAKFIQRYEVNGVRYVQITNWSKHQNPHHTEKSSDIPEANGALTVKQPSKNVKTQEQDGGNLADSLIPDSLIPEETREASRSTSDRTKTLKTYLAECKEQGVKPIPDDHFIRGYMADAGISDDMAQVAWLRFREEHLSGTRKAKRYIDWPATFANSVKDRWYRLWTCQAEGEAQWTSEGNQARQPTSATGGSMNAYDIPAEELSYSHEAECGVLGAILLTGPEAYDAAAAFITGQDFCQPLHRLLWAECEKLVLTGKYCDVVTLMEQMRGIEVDWVYINQLTQTFVSLRMARQHAEIIAKYAKERALRAAAGRVNTLATDETLEVSQRVAQAVTVLEDVIAEKRHAEPKPIADYAAEFIDRLNALADGDVNPGRATHIPTLDRMLAGGLRDEQLVIVAARPSVGKSSFAQQLALSAARDGTPAAFFGMEMTSRELTNRTVANLGRVRLTSLKTGKLDNDEWGRVTEGVEGLSTLPLYLHDQPAMTLADVGSKARALVRRSKIKLLVVDYLQLMKGNGKQERRVQLEEVTRGLKQLAKQLGITVVLLSQLNRAVEQRSNPRPMMSDLKECGAIEEDADVILALWTHKKGEEGAADIKGLICLKNRDGETGELPLHFEGQYQRWSESTASLAAPTKQVSAAKKYTEEF